jgi:TRAP-type C4-dicarboxylate transport system substrate-binding protein
LLIFCISFLTVTAIEAAEKVTWKYNTLHTGSYYHNVLMRELGKEVSERSGGRLEITIHPAGELGYKGTEIVRLLRDNILSISEVIGAFNARNLPVLSVAELPFFPPLMRRPERLPMLFAPSSIESWSRSLRVRF